jgi:hypothetical protein
MSFQLLAQTMYVQLSLSHTCSAFAELGVPNQRAAGASFPETKCPWNFVYGNSGKSPNRQNMYAF